MYIIEDNGDHWGIPTGVKKVLESVSLNFKHVVRFSRKLLIHFVI